MDQTPGFTIAICTYNRADYLPYALDSSLNQHYPAQSYEILVVDNNATDNTAEVAGRYAERDGRVRVVREESQGLSHARNRALVEARGQVAVFVDDDCILDSGYLRALHTLFAEEDNVGIVGGRVEVEWLERRPAGLDTEIDAFLNAFDYGRHRRELSWPAAIIGTSMAVPIVVAEQLGGFLTSLGRAGGSFAGGEDTEFCQRVQLAGLRVLYEPRCVCGHIALPERASWKAVRRKAIAHGRSNAHILQRHPRIDPRTYAVRWLLSRLRHQHIRNFTSRADYTTLLGGLGMLREAWSLPRDCDDPPPPIRRAPHGVGH